MKSLIIHVLPICLCVVLFGASDKQQNSFCALGHVVEHGDCCHYIVPDTNEVIPRGNCDDYDVIDILWVYTPDALNYIGSEAEILALCQQAVDKVNISFLNTGLLCSARIVGLHATEYEETEDYLYHLRNPNDGFMDEIHGIRDQKAADIVSLVTVIGYCGVAWVAPTNPSYGFQGCNASCMVSGGSAFRHELGHNLGSQHYVTDDYGYFPWSSGHRLTPKGGTEIGTVMGGNNIPHFSNPNVIYGGVPTGVPIGPDEEADNFSAFTVTVPWVADFRCSSDACPSDVNQDGTVGISDVLALLDAWGTCIGCDADIVFDGVVNVSDLLEIIGNWGSCTSGNP